MKQGFIHENTSFIKKSFVFNIHEHEKQDSVESNYISHEICINLNFQIRSS